MAALLAVIFTFQVYKLEIKKYFIRLITQLMKGLKTIRATKIFLIFLTVILIGMVILMLGLADDYLENDFSQFNKIAEYVVQSAIYMNWMKGFLVFQAPYAFCSIIAITIITIWTKDRNKLLEYLLLFVSIGGTALFHQLIRSAFTSFQSFGFVGEIYSANFPDLKATFMIIFYGTCLFLVIRHSMRSYWAMIVPLLGLVLLIGVAIVNIALTNVLPSDIVGGYVYGGVWVFFNFLLFEMLRLVLERY